MHEDNNPIGAWILYAFASFLLWIVLIFLKLLGVVRISWIGVVLGLFWLPLALMCLNPDRPHKKKAPPQSRRPSHYPAGKSDRGMDTTGGRRAGSGAARQRVRDPARGWRDRPAAPRQDHGGSRKRRKAGGQLNGLQNRGRAESIR